MSVLVVNNLFYAVSFSHFYGNNHFHNKPTINIKTSVTCKTVVIYLGIKGKTPVNSEKIKWFIKYFCRQNKINSCIHNMIKCCHSIRTVLNSCINEYFISLNGLKCLH